METIKLKSAEEWYYDKETPMLSKAIDTQVEQKVHKPVEQELTVKIKNGKVIMDWEDFGKLLCKQ